LDLQSAGNPGVTVFKMNQLVHKKFDFRFHVFWAVKKRWSSGLRNTVQMAAMSDFGEPVAAVDIGIDFLEYILMRSFGNEI
jgi:hypothetical protein